MQYEYRTTTLENGVRVASVELPWMRSVSVGLWAGTGARHEGEAQSGISHFVEHLLFKGTGRRSARQITADIEGVGGYINAFTSEDHTCYYAKASADHFGRVVDVLADMYASSLFPEDEIEREREVIREEILMVRDQPAQHAQELLSDALWPKHPLGRPLTGTAETIRHFRKADFHDFVRERYAGASTVVAVAGRVCHQQVTQTVRQALSNVPAGKKPAFRRAKFKPSAPRMRVVAQETEQIQLAIGYHTPGRHDRGRFALKLLSVVLGENMSSRLFQQLRERYGYCYSVHSCVSTFEETGLLGISAGLDPGKLEKATKLIRREVDRIRDHKLSRKELQAAKDYALGQTWLGLESTTNQMMWIGESILGYNRVIDAEDVEKALLEVTVDEVQAAAREFLDGSTRLGVALVGPEVRADQIAATLAN